MLLTRVLQLSTTSYETFLKSITLEIKQGIYFSLIVLDVLSVILSWQRRVFKKKMLFCLQN